MFVQPMINKNIRALPQAGISKIGDCGQCCLAGISGKSVKEIYDIQGFVDGLSYPFMLTLLSKLNIIYDNKLPHIDEWRFYPEWYSMGQPSFKLAKEWLEHAYSKINSGWIGICQIHIDGKIYEEEYINHWVLIYDIKFTDDMWKEDNVFVSCPTKGEYTINMKKFLKYYGGYNTIWVKI